MTDGPEPTFADVLNGLTFGRRRGQHARHEEPEPQPVALPVADDPPGEPVEVVESAAIVRPYAWTRGRTRSSLDLQVETMVSVARWLDGVKPGPLEHRTIVELCRTPRSVAEVAALLGVPLGVAKVLISDMAEAGLLTVHLTIGTASGIAHLNLMERVLSGLRRL
jgi:hypothetical protein